MYLRIYRWQLFNIKYQQYFWITNIFLNREQFKIEKESTFSEKLPCAKESMEHENESSDHINKYDLDDIDFIDMGRLIGVF